MKLVYFFELMLKQIKKKIFTFSLLAVQIFASAFVMVFVVTLLRYIGYNYSALNNFGNHDILLVSYEGDYVNGDVEYEKLKNTDNINVEKIYVDTVYADDSLAVSHDMYIYGNIMAENMELELKKGKQLRDSEVKDGAYPIIVPEFSFYAEQYEIGEVFELYYRNRVLSSGDHSDTYQPLKVYICGILKYPYRFYMTWSRLPLILENFLVTQDLSNDTFIFLKDFELISGIMFSENGDEVGSTVITEITAQDEESYRLVEADLYSEYGVTSVENLLDKSFDNYGERVGDKIVILIILSLFSIAGISGINLFLSEYLKKEYSLYFMCGATWSSCILIEVMRSFIVIVVPSVIGALSGYIYTTMTPEARYFADAYLILYVVLFIVVVYLISTLYFLIKLGRTKPIENIRLMVKE